MERFYDKNILLYRIITGERRIEFILTKNEDSSIQSIDHNSIICVSYDEMLWDTIEFHRSYDGLEKVIDKLCKALEKAKPGVMEILPKLDSFDNNSNILFLYYINKFKELFLSEVSCIYQESKPFSKKEFYKSLERINILSKNIKIISDESVFSYFRNVENTGFIVEPRFLNHPGFDVSDNSRAIVLINNSPVLFQISDASLINFFIDFSFEIYKLNEYICLCKHCHKPFFGIEGFSYCSNPKCQKEYKRIEKNRKEKESRNAPYKKPITTVRNDISTQKSLLRKKVNDDPDIVLEFEEETRIILEDTRNEFKRRKEEGLPPDDDSAEEFIRNQEATVLYLVKKLKKDYKDRNKS